MDNIHTEQGYENRNFTSWESYKRAYKTGKLLSCKTVACRVFQYSAHDQNFFRGFYNILLAISMFIIVPLTFLTYFFFDFSFLYVMGSLLLSWYLIKVCRQAHIQAMNVLAYKNEEFFNEINRIGGFRDIERNFYRNQGSLA